MLISATDVKPLLDLYRNGQYLQAFRAGEERFGALKEWEGPRGRMIAGRLAVHLGAPRLSLWHRLKAWREAPDDAEVNYYYAWTMMEREGPYPTWRFLRRQGEWPEADPEVRSSWLALHAQVLATLRDFDAAEVWMDRALETAPESPWVHTSRSGVLEREDRYEEALEAADRALELQPWFRPAVQSKGHLLTLFDRDDEAQALFEQAAALLECAAIYWQIGEIHYEREDHAAIEECLRKFEELSPLLEKHVSQQFFNVRSFLAYRAGDDAAAIEAARSSGHPKMQKIADRLADPTRRDGKRVLLPVGFTRQHHVTCVPATLTTISRYWSQSVEHLQLADEICYNGTTAHAERAWAESQGWVVREFTVTEGATRALIDAGAPFTLTTTSPGMGHLQAVIGYDARRGTIVIRDPYVRSRGEAFADEFLEDFRAFGPRGMVLVPEGERHRLDGIELPDTEFWDELHRIDGALIAHRREEAAGIVESLTKTDGTHTLTLLAQWRLAMYDANPLEQLAVVDALLEKYPDNDVLRLSQLSLLGGLGRRDRRLEILEKYCADPEVHPAIRLQHARELMQDAREFPRAEALLRQTLRDQPLDQRNYSSLASLRWGQQQFEEGLELYRFAACLDDKNEQPSESYFLAAQHCRQTDVALDWLRRRFERFGDKSSAPARTLDGALGRLERTGESLELLERALERRPDDGELKLYVAGVIAMTSDEHAARAEQLLEEARDHTSRTQWLRVASRMAEIRGEREEALERAEEILVIDPLAIDAHALVARLTLELKGNEAALAHLQEAVDRFPHYQPLLELYSQWLRDEPPERAETVVRSLIQLNPANAWAVRELGFLLVRQRRFDEAQECADEAGRLEPTSSAWHGLCGTIHLERGQLAEARSAFRAAVRLEVDNDYAIERLLNCCDTPAERREELEFVRQELVRQVIFGDGLLAYRALAHRVLEPEELLSQLQEGLEARPDLWHAWSACVRQLIAMQRLDEAAETARQATERFPLLPIVWLDRATVCRLNDDPDGELECLESAHRINPGWSNVLRTLSDVYLRRGDLQRARSILENAVSRDPLNGVNRGWLAELLWRLDERQEALEQIGQAVELEPGYDWAWNTLRAWSAELGEPERPKEAARRLTASKPGEARSWLVLEQVLDGEAEQDEALAALEQAIQLNPRSIEAHSRRAVRLAVAGRVEEALEACRPAIWGDSPPSELEARAAWIEWRSGNPEEAIARMERALEASPRMYGEWQVLADWRRELGDVEGYRAAAETMAQLDPHNEVTLGYLGEALLNCGDRAGAKRAFAKSRQIDPAYLFGGLLLFDLQVEDGEWEEAEGTLTDLELHVGGRYVLARRIQMAAHQESLYHARRALQTLCTTPAENEDPWPLRHALDVMQGANWLREMDEVVTGSLEAPDVDPHVGELWSRVQVLRRSWFSGRRLEALVQQGEIGRHALQGWVLALIDAGEIARFRSFVAENENWLGADTLPWGTTCMGWAACRDYAAGRSWAESWESHPDAEPWMLVNVAEIFRNTGDDELGARVNRRALELPPDNTESLHALWLAVDDVRRDELEEAFEQLQRVNPDALDNDYQFLLTMIEAELVLASSSPDERAEVSRECRHRIDELVRDYKVLRLEPARRRVYRHCLAATARRSGGLGPLLWSWWRRLTTA